MRIHRLAFAGLGPFADEHTIDFDALGDGALFIIEGPTGAGKSTIVDALVFALYGDVAGSESDRQRLRSDFADPSDPSFAEVEFSTSRGTYRVRRTPEFTRPKRKGTGETVERATTQLWQATSPGNWQSVSTKHQEADAEIYRAVGLDKSQFLQTVVLPQGEFAEFLRARSSDRQVILEKIFATSMYRSIQQWCDQQRKEAEQELEDADRALRDAANRLVGRLQEDLPPQLDVASWQQSLLTLQPGTQEATATLAEVDDLAEQAATAAGHARQQVETAKQALVRQQQALERLREARSAQEELQGATVALDVARAALKESADGLRQCLIDYPGLDLQEQTDAATVSAQVDQQRGSVQALLERAAGAGDLQQQMERAERDVQRVAGMLQQLTHERSVVIPAQLAEIVSQLQKASDQATAQAQIAHETEQVALRGHLAGMAATLATNLHPGQPCPVCGSVEHPVPASPSGALVSAEDLERANLHRQQAQEDAGRAQADLQAVNTVVAGLGAAGNVNEGEPMDLQPRRLEQIQQRLIEIDAERSTMTEQLAQCEAMRQRRQDELQLLQQECQQAAAPFSSLDERMAALQAVRAAAQEVIQATNSEQVAAERQAKAVAVVRQSPPDASDTIMDGVRVAVETALQDHSAAVSAADQMERLASATATFGHNLRQASERCEQLRAQNAAIIRLADVLNGRMPNRLQQPLATFVVQQMFEEVVAAANHRLQAMLGGRFALVSTEEATGRERLLGLGLAVRDLATEAIRKPQTLSGGESFCASLALALGLADTVRANAGGVEIGMLIVDEGFGSLDSERLDDVMGELTRLRADGRTVGVISHVTEMQRTITERISVRPRSAGRGSNLSVSWQT